MVADLNRLEFQSDSFAKIICRENKISLLHDATLYVFTNDRKDWNDAVIKVQKSIEESKIKALWHLPFSIKALTDFSVFNDDIKLLEYINNGACYNVLMPLKTPDRSYKCYLIGTVDNVEHLEMAFAVLTLDAQKVFDECSFAAFAASIETEPNQAKELWFKLLDYNKSKFLPKSGQISFKGKFNVPVSEYTFLGSGFEKIVKTPPMEYGDWIDSLKNFPDIVESISKRKDNDLYDNQVKFTRICQRLSSVDKNELILELAKRIDDKKILSQAIETVFNKAKNARLKVHLGSKRENGKIDGRRIAGDWYTYLVDNSGKKQWLDFEPTSHVIYIMNLIYRINNPDLPSMLDIKRYKKVFVDIYNFIYGDEGEEKYNRLYSKNGTGDATEALKNAYKIITNCINLRCSFFNESPSPYIVNLNKPLTIPTDLIDISEFMKLDKFGEAFDIME